MNLRGLIPRRLRPACKWLWYRVSVKTLGVSDDSTLLGWLTTVGDGAVVAGPFRGMRTACESHGSSLLPKLIGTYELELAPFWTPEWLGAYRTVVNLGCAEGFYLAGIAVVLQSAGLPLPSLHGFDIQPLALDLCRRTLTRNGLCIATLAATGWERVLDHAVGPTLVICDIEGAEKSELDPVRVPALRHAHVICEVHDEPGTTSIRDLLMERFSATHRVAEHTWRPRTLSDFPAIPGLHVTDHVKRMAMDEHRSKGWRWMLMTPWPAMERNGGIKRR